MRQATKLHGRERSSAFLVHLAARTLVAYVTFDHRRKPLRCRLSLRERTPFHKEAERFPIQRVVNTGYVFNSPRNTRSNNRA